jgi:hypothetical protein
MALETIINGRPTRTQVDKLFARLKDTKDGEIIRHAEVETLIGEGRKSDRYRTVISATRRKLMNELGVAILPERGVGFIRSTGIQQVNHRSTGIGRDFKRAARKVREVAAVTDDRLDETGRKMRNFVVERATCLVELAKTSRKEIALTLNKPELLPR